MISQTIENTDTIHTFQKGGISSTADNRFRLVERHFSSYVPATEKKLNATRRCVVCKDHGTREEIHYECVRYDVDLRAAPCF